MPREDETAAVAAALRIIKEALFAFGAEGDECIQRLVSLEAALKREAPEMAELALFRAFYAGLTDQAPDGLDDAAYRTGARAARLNEASRQDGGMNVGPFDTPNVRWALEKAARSTCK